MDGDDAAGVVALRKSSANDGGRLEARFLRNSSSLCAEVITYMTGREPRRTAPKMTANHGS